MDHASHTDGSEGFHDYTVATPWEKLTASIENSLRSLITKDLPQHAELQQARGDGPPLALATRLRHRLPFRTETYTLCLHLPPLTTAASEGSTPLWALSDQPHKLQEWFRTGPCLSLAPDSYSGRVLDTEEAHTLLSAGIVALSHVSLPWPLFIPVHDPLRDAYRGAAVTASGAVVHFETDSMHSSSLPMQFTYPAAQLDAFAARLRTRSPAAAALCAREAAAAAAVADDTGDFAAAPPGEGVHPGRLAPSYFVRRSYEVPDQQQRAVDNARQLAGSYDVELVISSWDEEAPWRPWAAEDDPIECLELDVLWHFTSAAAAAAAAPPLAAAQAGAASAWRLAALRCGYERDTGRRPLIMLRVADQYRPFLHLTSITGLADGQLLGAPVPLASLPGEASFCAMLLRMAEHWGRVAGAQDVGQLASERWWGQQGSYLPAAPQSFVLQDAIRDLFQAPILPVWPGSSLLGDAPGVEEDAAAATTGAGLGGHVGKAAPLRSLTTRLALHALRLGNPRAVAMLWQRFLRELQFAHWEAAVQLPRMAAAARQQQPGPAADGCSGLDNAAGLDGPATAEGEVDNAADAAGRRPDHAHCLLHQKLQLLDLSIQMRQVQHAQRAAGADGPARAPSLAASARSDSLSLYLSTSAASEEEEDAATGWRSPSHPLDSLATAVDEPTCHAAPAALASPAGLNAGLEDYAHEATAADAHMHAVEPEGVACCLPGAMLLHHPDRPLNIPVTQDPPVLTEDLVEEHQAALQALPAAHSSPDVGPESTRMRLQGALLQSDMQAFKAANPGSCLADFARWHSPRDWVQGEGGRWGLSQRMTGKANAWQALWDGAPAVPAVRQRPLFQAVLEGERALHFLETLPPAALYAQLLALGFSAALQMLKCTASAAALPAVAAQLARLEEVFAALLSSGVAAWAMDGARQMAATPDVDTHSESRSESGSEGPASAAHAGPAGPAQSVLHSLLGAGLRGDSVPALVRVLGCVEQTVAAGQSLLQRLAPPVPLPEAVAISAPSDQALVGEGGSGSFAARAADGLIAAALGVHSEARYGCVVPVAQPDWGALGSMMAGSAGSSAAAVEEQDTGGTATSAGPSAWAADPFLTEWAVEIREGDSSASGTEGPTAPPQGRAAEGMLGAGPAPLHRMFVKLLPTEMRVATTVTTEM